MTYKSLLVTVTGRDEDAEALAAAFQLAASCEAAVTVLPSYPDLATDLVLPFDMPLSPELADKLRDLETGWNRRIAVMTESARLRFGAQSGQSLDGGVHVAPREGAQWLGVVKHMPLADLTIMAWAGARNPSALGGLLSDVMFHIRAPVLIARGEGPVVDRPAALAWDNSPEAGRALHAAMPLLRKARSVVVLQDPDGLDWQQQGAAAPSRLADYLAMHGVLGVSVQEVRGNREGPALLEAAEAAGAAVLVSGAYGHGRLQEWMLGGATRSFLTAPTGPHLLLCH